MTQRDVVRVKVGDADYNLSAHRAKQLGKAVEIVDKPTHNPDGTEVPPRYKTTVAKIAAAKKAASQASKPTDSPEPGEKADTPATDKEN